MVLKEKEAIQSVVKIIDKNPKVTHSEFPFELNRHLSFEMGKAMVSIEFDQQNPGYGLDIFSWKMVLFLFSKAIIYSTMTPGPD